MIEKPANGVRGFFLYDPFEDQHFFRVYGEVDPKTGRKSFTDYKVLAEDIEVTIESTGLSLYETENGNCLNWGIRRRAESSVAVQAAKSKEKFS